MAIVRVQAASNIVINTSSVTAVFGSPVTTGNCVLILVGAFHDTTVINSVTDTASNTYTFVSGTHSFSDGNPSYTEFWIAKNVTGGFTNVTAHYSSGTDHIVIGIIEYSGVSTTMPTGVAGVLNSQPSGNPVSPSLTITAATSALVSAAFSPNGALVSVDSPWNTATNPSSVWWVADYIPGSSGTFQATFNNSDPQTWNSSGVELLAAPPIVRVQEASTFGSGTSLTSTFTSPVTGGNCVLACVGSSVGGATITSVTDTAGNSYSFVSGTHAINGNGYIGELWIATNVTGGFTFVTAHYSAGGSTQVLFTIEYSGVASTGVSGELSNQGPSHPLSPSLTITAPTSVLVTLLDGVGGATSVNAPWTFIDSESAWAIADLAPGSPGTYQATFNPSNLSWGSSGAELLAITPPLTLNLSDSVSSSDSMVDSFSVPLSDSASSSDTAPDSFSVQSDFVVPVKTPVVETLAGQLIPAQVKVYFNIQE